MANTCTTAVPHRSHMANMANMTLCARAVPYEYKHYLDLADRINQESDLPNRSGS